MVALREDNEGGRVFETSFVRAMMNPKEEEEKEEEEEEEESERTKNGTRAGESGETKVSRVDESERGGTLDKKCVGKKSEEVRERIRKRDVE